MAKKVFDKGMFEAIWPMICMAPDTQMSEQAREEITDFDFANATPLEVYIFCSEFAASAYATNDISSFVRVLLDVSNYYERPPE